MLSQNSFLSTFKFQQRAAWIAELMSNVTQQLTKAMPHSRITTSKRTGRPTLVDGSLPRIERRACVRKKPHCARKKPHRVRKKHNYHLKIKHRWKGRGQVPERLMYHNLEIKIIKVFSKKMRGRKCVVEGVSRKQGKNEKTYISRATRIIAPP